LLIRQYTESGNSTAQVKSVPSTPAVSNFGE